MIQEIERHPVKSTQEALFTSRNASHSEILLRVRTKGNSHYLSIAKGQHKQIPTLVPTPK